MFVFPPITTHQQIRLTDSTARNRTQETDAPKLSHVAHKDSNARQKMDQGGAEEEKLKEKRSSMFLLMTQPVGNRTSDTRLEPRKPTQTKM